MTFQQKNPKPFTTGDGHRFESVEQATIHAERVFRARGIILSIERVAL